MEVDRNSLITKRILQVIDIVYWYSNSFGSWKLWPRELADNPMCTLNSQWSQWLSRDYYLDAQNPIWRSHLQSPMETFQPPSFGIPQ